MMCQFDILQSRRNCTSQYNVREKIPSILGYIKKKSGREHCLKDELVTASVELEFRELEKNSDSYC